MKKSLLLIAVIAIAAFSSCNTASKSIKTEQDSVAYAIGLDLGNYVKNVDSTLNVDIVAQAIKDVIANKPAMKSEDAYAFLREYFMVRKPAKVKKESEDFIANVAKENKKAQTTASGLIYEVISEGTDKATSDSDTVVVNYKGTLPDGKVFDSSYDRNEPATFPLSNVIPAWTEGMKLVGKGGKIKLWVPSELGYGEQGAGNMIAPNQALVFEVEILDVKPAAAAPAAPAK